MSPSRRVPAELADELRSALAEGVAGGVAPAVGLLIGAGRDVLLEMTCGTLAGPGSAAASVETVYDLSSLTKPLVTTSAIATLVAEGRLELDAPASEIVPELLAGDDADARRAITVRRLLTHCSGLPAHERFFENVPAERLGSRDGYREVVERAARATLIAAPGSAATYSDLGFILLGEIVERVSGSRLDHFASERLLSPLGARGVSFRPLVRTGPCEATNEASRVNVAPCGACEWRRTEAVHGEVQDENAWAMGGVAGHAGLFGDLAGVHSIVAEWVEAHAGRGRVLLRPVVQALWTRSAEPPSTTWAHGWDTPSPSGSTAGRHIGRLAFGHLGFTGTSIWIDLRRGVHVVLLTNRVHPERASTGIRDFRPRIHDLVFGRLCTSTS